MGTSNDLELPFYPSYEIEVRGHVIVWWFVKDFSQSRYNYQQTPSGSNACTIITVLLAARCHYEEVELSATDDCNLSSQFVYCFAECILEGNKIHEYMRRNGILTNINLTVPEAIQSVGNRVKNIVEWRSMLYMTNLGESLFKNLRSHLMDWYNTTLYETHPDLYIILIADHRSVLFVVEDYSDTITVMDSHQHLTHGAIVAQVPRVRLKALCHWFHGMLSTCFDSDPTCYELSFLYFKKSNTKNKCTSASMRKKK